MSNLLGPRDANGIPVPMKVEESIASMKASLLKKIKRSAYVYRVDCGGCNGCEIEIFATLTPLFDAERFGIKVVPSPRHADILLFTGAVTRAMRSPALRAWQSAPDPKICISYGACGNSGGIFHDLGGCLHSRLPADARRDALRLCNGAGSAGAENSCSPAGGRGQPAGGAAA